MSSSFLKYFNSFNEIVNNKSKGKQEIQDLKQLEQKTCFSGIYWKNEGNIGLNVTMWTVSKDSLNYC